MASKLAAALLVGTLEEELEVLEAEVELELLDEELELLELVALEEDAEVVMDMELMPDEDIAAEAEDAREDCAETAEEMTEAWEAEAEDAEPPVMENSCE